MIFFIHGGNLFVMNLELGRRVIEIRLYISIYLWQFLIDFEPQIIHGDLASKNVTSELQTKIGDFGKVWDWVDPGLT